MPDVRLSIVIVTFNAVHDVVACLTSLSAAGTATPFEIIVVDNASTDAVRDRIAQAFPHVDLVGLPANLGFARANNVGIRRARGEFVLLLNGDTIVPPEAIDAMVAVLDREPRTAVVGPRLVDRAGRVELSFGRMLSPWSEFQQKRRVRALARREARAVAWLDAATRRRHTPDWVSGACLLVRRTVAEAAGMLDERYFLYTEDVDFCAAVRALGWTICFTPDAEVLHHGGRSGASAPSATAGLYRRSQVAFYEKHHPRWAPLLKAYLWLKGAWPPPPLGRETRPPEDAVLS